MVALLPKRPRLARQLVKVLCTEAFERADRPPEHNQRICQPRAQMKLEVHVVRHHDEVEKPDARHLRHLGEPPLHGKPERRFLELGIGDRSEKPPSRVGHDCDEERRTPRVVIPVKPPIPANLLLSHYHPSPPIRPKTRFLLAALALPPAVRSSVLKAALTPQARVRVLKAALALPLVSAPLIRTSKSPSVARLAPEDTQCYSASAPPRVGWQNRYRKETSSDT